MLNTWIYQSGENRFRKCRNLELRLHYHIQLFHRHFRCEAVAVVLGEVRGWWLKVTCMLVVLKLYQEEVLSMN